MSDQQLPLDEDTADMTDIRRLSAACLTSPSLVVLVIIAIGCIDSRNDQSVESRSDQSAGQVPGNFHTMSVGSLLRY